MDESEFRVLLVEDDPRMVGRIRRALSGNGNRGFRTCVAASLDEAVARLGDAGVVLLDLGIGGGKGHAALRRFREAAPDVPIVVLAPTADGPCTHACLQCGAQEVLPLRDASPEELVRSLLDARDRQEFLHDREARLREEERRRRETEFPEALARLAGGVAHDLSGVLTAILGLSEQTLEHPDAGESVLRRARAIRDAALRGATAVDQLLDYGGREVALAERLRPGEVVSGLRQRMARLLREGTRVRLRIDRRVPAIRADRRQLEHAVLALVEHARDSMPSGGYITVDAAPAVGAPPRAEIAVTDQGPGLDEEARRRLFEPFYSSRVLGAGSGLGLATVGAIARQAGGTVEVEGDLGRGTTVRLVLPGVDDDAPPGTGTATATRIAERAARDSRRAAGSPGAARVPMVLLVEPDDAVRDVVSSTLRDLGLGVVDSASPGDAVRLVAAHPGTVDLLVAEAVSPGLGGPALASLVREACPDLKVLLLASTPEAASAARRADPDTAVLRLPFGSRDLARIVAEALGRDP